MNLGRLPGGTRYILGVSTGEGLHRRSTLRAGDLLLFPDGSKAMVGLQIRVDAIYPVLWSDWRWES